MDESFYFCQNLKQIEIPPNSELISIGKKAFYNTSIKKITFPPNLTLIGQSAFLHCKKLKEIEFLTNHEDLTIESIAFNSSPIETILILSKIAQFSKDWSSSFTLLKNITIYPCEKQNIMYYNNEFIL